MLSKYDLNASVAEGLMIWLEVRNDGSFGIENSSLETLCKAAEIYEGRIFGVVFGDTELKPMYEKIFSLGVDTLYHVKDKRLKEYHPEAYCNALKAIAERINPLIILAGATLRGSEVLPRLAASINSGMIADCTGLSMEGTALKIEHSIGKESVISECIGSPQMATARPGSFKISKAKKDGTGTVIYWQYRGEGFKRILSAERIS